MDGKIRHYTPDFEVTRIDGTKTIEEIKSDRAAAKSDNLARFPLIAEALFNQYGVGFKLVAESEILRDPGCRTVHLLHMHRQVQFTSDEIALTQKIVTHGGGVIPLGIFERGPLGRFGRAKVLALTYHDYLRFDLDAEITSDTMVSLGAETIATCLANGAPRGDTS